jgi:hypothetical protein
MGTDWVKPGGVRPYALRHVLQNPLARLLPFGHARQNDVYRMGERVPPDDLNGFAPTWECVNVVLPALKTAQARVNLQNDFHYLATAGQCSSNLVGGFRAQLYDMQKKRNFMDRGVPFANFCGPFGEYIFLREPYEFDQHDSQILVLLQNFEAVANTIQIVMYGVALPFNVARAPMPGGSVPNANLSGWGR